MKPRKDKPQEELFPFVEMEKLIPEHHILRLIDRNVDFSFIARPPIPTYVSTKSLLARKPPCLTSATT